MRGNVVGTLECGGVHFIRVGNTDVESHSFLHYMVKRYGTDAVESALDDRLSGGEEE